MQQERRVKEAQFIQTGSKCYVAKVKPITFSDGCLGSEFIAVKRTQRREDEEHVRRDATR